MGLASFVDDLQARGRYFFTKEEVRKALRVSESALKLALIRLSKKGRLVSPRREFFVIVPLEYKSARTLPPEWFIDELMKFQEQPYYVGLLSAAALHGAGHQQPQKFQVVTNKPLRPIEIGRFSIQFFVKKRIDSTQTVDIKTPTGAMKVSSVEETAFDVVRYMDKAGQLGNVATVLKELSEKLKPKVIKKVLENEVEISVAQRLGYLLENLDKASLAFPIHDWLSKNTFPYIPLVISEKIDRKKVEKDPKWMILINEKIELDI